MGKSHTLIKVNPKYAILFKVTSKMKIYQVML